MIALHSFHILTHNGESVLPDTIQRQRAENQNSSILFYLDANLCLDIVSYFENKIKHPPSKTNIEILILSFISYDIEILYKDINMEKDINDILTIFRLERNLLSSIEPLDIKLLENLRTTLEYDIKYGALNKL